MARPKNKSELVEAANQQFFELQKWMDKLSAEDQQTDFDFSIEFLSKQKGAHWQRDKNLRDILIHLYEWHQLLLNWVKSNQEGVGTSFLPAPYNWRTYGEMNQRFVEKHQTTTLAQAKEWLANSHEEVMALLIPFSNEELFSKGQFAWVGNTTLGSYFISSTSSHYDWATKKLKVYVKLCQE